MSKLLTVPHSYCLTVVTSVLTARHENLMKQTKQLETQRNNLTEQIRNMETEWSENSVARDQQSIDAYCPKESGSKFRFHN